MMEPPKDISAPLRRALFVVNRKSRSGADGLDPVRAQLSAGGIELVERHCPTATRLSPLIAADGAGLDMVVIGGGDGTLNAALEGLVATGLPLGLLPLGTGNDFARTLSIPTDPVAAARVIVAGRVRRVDLGWVNGKHFVNVASVGLSTWLAKAMTHEVKRRWGRLGYGVGALNAWRRARPFKARINCDGTELALSTLMVAIGNGRHFGGGMVVAKNASIVDSRLDLFTLGPCNLARFISLLPWLKSGRHGELLEIQTLRGQAIDLDTVPALPINTDGEITTVTPARFRVRPQALPVLVPPAVDQE